MYIATDLKELITINKIYTVHYFEYSCDFVFEKERHDFWEVVYVESGEVSVLMDDKELILGKGDLAFFTPNMWHKVETANKTTPNVMILSFLCKDPAMSFFDKGLFKIDDKERGILAALLVEARHFFSCPLNDPYTKKMEVVENPLIGSEHLIKLYLEIFLIHLLRRYSLPEVKSSISKINNSSEQLNIIINYMEENIYSKLSIKQICEDNLINRMQLQNLFNKELELSPMEYFINLKISYAKKLIRTGKMNFNQISEKLGYNTVHYFSKQFKKVTGMTPTDYAQSIKALSERE